MEETIAAVTTPPGEGAIAAIRISGPDAIAVGKKIFSGPVDTYLSHTAHYGKILGAGGESIDTVLLLVMRAPRSYTGEDCVEIFCHGGMLIKDQILKRIFAAGARAARPGEFSLRAFLNGKMDLAQAEAVQRVIAAKSEWALRAAGQQLEGALSKKIASFQKRLTDFAAIVEASVDFPEEGLEFATPEEMVQNLHALIGDMRHLQATFHEGKFLHEGLSLCLLGAPNVGKSSLMNALLGKERAIVTEIAGTTRDILEEDLRFADLHFKLIDTAGIRQTEERIEQEGIRRSRQMMQQADLILLILDASRSLTEEDRALMAQVPEEKTIFVWNKTDVASAPERITGAIEISAEKLWGLDALRRAIQDRLWKQGTFGKEEVLLTQLRHYEALTRAIGHCEVAVQTLQREASPEFTTSDLRAALGELGLIIGVDVTEDILSSIFSKFCLGK
ncbi:MAG: tRNA uridine-5-carboxymethylaminomethyl(34) synthesis GTPase MnmE [Chlamydiia bacterium]|nr:tRNA uridine-5-carboxymethylaminomethyl(34) synthesis GTPase MnmE [Chlamydiia bacterium]